MALHSTDGKKKKKKVTAGSIAYAASTSRYGAKSNTGQSKIKHVKLQREIDAEKKSKKKTFSQAKASGYQTPAMKRKAGRMKLMKFTHKMGRKK